MAPPHSDLPKGLMKAEDAPSMMATLMRNGSTPATGLCKGALHCVARQRCKWLQAVRVATKAARACAARPA